MDVISQVDAVLRETIKDHQARWSNESPYFDVTYTEIEALVLGGGKRIRPQFCYWGWVAAGGQDSHATPISLGASIELLHAMALFHDDVIDDSSTRRGQLTAHRRLSHQHQSAELLGESRRYGEGLAILIGDITAVMADVLIGNISSEARMMWNELRLEMNHGQFLDTIGSAHRERSMNFAQTVSQLKTAKYTIERPLHLGAIAADAQRGAQLLPMLSAYGLPLGEAFQLRDDLLGAFGDEEVVGKPVGGDFREGKPTALLAFAMQNASPSQLDILHLVGTSELSASQIADIQQVFTETGAVSEIESRIHKMTQQAKDALLAQQLNGDAFRALNELADVTTQRIV